MKDHKTLAMRLTFVTFLLGICLALLGCDPMPTGFKPAGAIKETKSPTAIKVADNRLVQLSWMVGNWIDEDGNDLSEERWTPSAGGTMFGLNRTIIDGEIVNFEYMRIQVTPKGIVYFAAPRGRYPPTPFGLTKYTKQSAVFYNGDKESPMRIFYRREGNRLYGRIEGEIDGEKQSSEWSWKLESP
ncbi:MAG: hypothetical protein IH984_01080 [Planctomycetes bacterium]|nr:hypothetical protein [Planctomycetota bacterium]